MVTFEILMSAPRLPSFIRLNKHRRFSITPRYYDERKERIEKIKKKYQGEEESSAELRDRLKESWGNRKRTTSSQYPFGRLVLIMVFLFLIAYLLLF